jgi:NAD-specific glutamate dehydrogenase
VFQRDYILRAVQQAAEALARALKLLLSKKEDEAEQALVEGYAALGIDRELLLMLDAKSLRSQLADDSKVAMAARLLLGDAELRHARGDSKAALRRLRAAIRLAEELPAPDAQLTADLARVRRALGAD